MTKEKYINVKITADDKEAAKKTLADMGLTLSQAVRHFLQHVVRTKALPFVIGKAKEE